LAAGDPTGRAYSAPSPQTPIAEFRDLLLRGGEKEGREEEEREGRGRDG